MPEQDGLLDLLATLLLLPVMTQHSVPMKERNLGSMTAARFWTQIGEVVLSMDALPCVDHHPRPPCEYLQCCMVALELDEPEISPDLHRYHALHVLLQDKKLDHKVH